MNIESIKDRLRADASDEFNKLRIDMSIYMDPKKISSASRKDLSSFLQAQLKYRNELLLDTLINYLMESAKNYIMSCSYSIINSFYKENFREQTRKLFFTYAERPIVLPIEHTVSYSLAGGGLILIGALCIGCKYFPPSQPLKTIIVLPIALGIGAAVYRVIRYKLDQIYWKVLINEVNKNILESEAHLLSVLWLVADQFSNNFEHFCKKNSIL